MNEKKSRRKFSTEQKTAILREHFADKVSVVDICEKHGLQPSHFYQWRQVLLDNLEAAMEKGNKRRRR
ncbi:MAG: transposase, partial [Deltaproteobacteria bacterium]|nr:transposase [Deltaproteobacteria bacterium]